MDTDNRNSATSSDPQNVIIFGEHARRKRKRKHNPDDLNNPLSQLDVYRLCDGVWAKDPALKDHLYRLLCIFINRTIRHGYDRVTITTRRLIKGDNHHAGYPKGRSSTLDHINKLCELGYIRRLPAEGDALSRNRGDTYVVNYRKDEDEMLSISAERKEEETKEADPRPENWITPIQKAGPPPSKKLDPINRNTPIETNYRTTSPGSADASPAVGSGLGEGDYSSPEENLDSVPAEKSENVNQGSVSKAAADVLAETKARPTRNTKRGSGPADLEATFVAACTDSFAEVGGYNHVKWTKKDMGKVRAVFINRWGKDVEDLHQFFEFVGSKWSQIRKEYFHGMDRPAMPIAPDLGFLFHRNKTFIAAWRDKVTFDGLKKLTNRDQRQYHYLTKDEGKSHEEALRIIGERAATRKMREENEQAVQNVRALKRLAGCERKTAERVRNQKIFSAGKPRGEFMTGLAIKAEESRQEMMRKRQERVGTPPKCTDEKLMDDFIHNPLPDFPEWDENK